MSHKNIATLQSIAEVKAEIESGKPLFLAGSREVLSQLPKGNWVGGSISYFMSEEGWVRSEDRIFATAAPVCATGATMAAYGPAELANLHRDAPANGFTYVVLPASSQVHKTFAEQAPNYDGFVMNPVVGWVAGVRVDRIGIDAPVVFNGQTGEAYEDKCVALHVALPADKIAEIDIVNIFENGGGDPIRFEHAGFHVENCLIDGKPANLADYIAAKGIRTEFPLVGDYNGSLINVSFQKVDAEAHAVELFAPVFPGVDYHFAKPVEDYAQAFGAALEQETEEPAFACNCILNFLHGKLEGKKAGHFNGPITFGEIAHQLLNQTLVRLDIREVK